ncbi:MAG: hypothetical protein HFE51_04565 [Clostridia bacterium]|nr:hypothetical protein [Clostridia bacterium]MCI9085678.1 hypothetical protein [Clostridia bacterium]
MLQMCYSTKNDENVPVTAEMDKYSFTMLSDDVTITVIVTPRCDCAD